jgi:cell division protein FtsL
MTEMDNLTHIVNKVKQAPWRVQRQWIGLILLVLVMVAMVASFYISVNASAAISGRQIQLLMADIENDKQENANMEAELARLTAAEAMQSRAEALGFEPASTDEITYVTVPGFVEKSPIDLSTQSSSIPVSLIKAEYKETLFDWFTRQMTASGEER